MNGWAVPTSGYVTSPYGYRVHPVYGYVALHTGVDISASCGQPTYAASGGTIEYAGWNGTYGYFIRINHGGGVTTAYAHIQQGGILVQTGQPVAVGQQIARAGTTGASTGCHTHLEVRINGSSTDPIAFLRNKGLSVG